MATGRRRDHELVPLVALIGRELKSEKMEKLSVRFGSVAKAKKGEDYLMKTDCQRVPGNVSSAFSVFIVQFAGSCPWEVSFKSREDHRKQLELEEARKAGLATA